MKKLVLILLAFSFSMIVGHLTASQFEAGAIVQSLITGGLFVASFIPMPSGITAVYAFVSVNKQSTNAGRVNPKQDQIILFRTSDVSVFPSRDANGVLITADLVLNAGAVAIELYSTPSKTDLKNTSEGEADAKGFLQNLILEHPGNSLAVKEFLNNNINENLCAIVRYCDGSTPQLLGSLCNPLQFDVETLDNFEANKATITLHSMLPGNIAADFSGAIPTLDTDSGSGSGA